MSKRALHYHSKQFYLGAEDAHLFRALLLTFLLDKHMDTPCGQISIFDSSMNRVPFTLQANENNVPYNVDWQNGGEKLVTTQDNYTITTQLGNLIIGCTYKIQLQGLTLHYGDSDEHTECVSGISEQYCIAIGAYDYNDEEKIAQFTSGMGFPYDKTKFVEYDIEMLSDCSGFAFCILGNASKPIVFDVAWIKHECGIEDEYESAVQFWTT